MAQTMTPSNPMTTRQIGKAVAHYRDMLLKHRTEIGSSEAVQQVLGQDDYIGEQVGVLRKYVGMITGMIMRLVNVDRTRTIQQSLDATGRKQYVDKAVVETAPRREGTKVRFTYFKPRPEAYDRHGWLSPEKLAGEYEFFGLVPDLQAQADDNAAHPEFADTTPNACQWIDEHGKYCCGTFRRWFDERGVSVDRSGGDWHGYWSFGGVPQGSSASAV